MSTVTHSRKSKIVSRHLDPPSVEPVNARAVKAHDVGKSAFTALQWAPALALCVIVLTAASGFLWARQTLTYAQIGQGVCNMVPLDLATINCDMGTLECATNPEVMVISEMNRQAEARNLWQARACIRTL